MENDFNNTLVMLECFELSCMHSPDMTGIAMRYKDYQPEVHFCKKCGAELITKEQYRARMELLDMGVNPFVS